MSKSHVPSDPGNPAFMQHQTDPRQISMAGCVDPIPGEVQSILSFVRNKRVFISS